METNIKPSIPRQQSLMLPEVLNPFKHRLKLDWYDFLKVSARHFASGLSNKPDHVINDYMVVDVFRIQMLHSSVLNAFGHYIVKDYLS